MTKHGKLSSAQYQDKLRNVQKRRSRQREEDLRSLLGEDWGRRVLYWLVYEIGCLHAPSFAGGIKDGIASAMHMSKTEGLREMASELLRLAENAAPEAYLKMMAEQIRTRQADMAYVEEAELELES